MRARFSAFGVGWPIVPELSLFRLRRLACGFHRLLFSRVGFELIRRLFNIATGDDVVSLEYGLSLVTADRHRHALRHADADKVSDSRSAEVVKQQTRQLCSTAR